MERDARRNIPTAPRYHDEKNFLSSMLRTRISSAIRVYKKEDLRHTLDATYGFVPLPLAPEFVKLPKLRSTEAEAWLYRQLRHVLVQRHHDRGTADSQIWAEENFPDELIAPYRKLQWDFYNELRPSLRVFSPWSMLALVQGGRVADSQYVTIPPEGITFELAMRLAETYCTMVSFAESTQQTHNYECSIELVAAMRRLFMRQLRYGKCAPHPFDKLEDAWNQSTESKVAYTSEFFDTLGQIANAFCALARQRPNTRQCFIKDTQLRQPKRVTICEYRYNDPPPSQQWGQRQPDLASHLGTVIENSVQRFKRGPIFATVRKDVYSAPQSQPQKRGASTQKGKKTADTTERKAAPGKSVELLKCLTATKASEVIKAHPSKTAPTVATATDASQGVCLRAMSSGFGGCPFKKCKLYHFPTGVTNPPAGVQLDNLLAFLQAPEVQALVVPTELGKKVLRPL
jgi:hypothetical protein